MTPLAETGPDARIYLRRKVDTRAFVKQDKGLRSPAVSLRVPRPISVETPLEAENLKIAAHALIEAGEAFHARGWVPASSGNFSVRLPGERLAITASGRHKGMLGTGDIICTDLEGQVLEGEGKPSYETGLHTQLYRHSAKIGAVLHTHSVPATVLSRKAGDALVLRDYELLKIFEGIDSHETSVSIPVYDNDQDIAALAQRIEDDMQKNGMGHAYMIRGHGIYTWGPDIRTTRHRVEALEFMLECEILSQP